ncbi:NADH-quinone oxidoreductase subunit NuoH [Propionivibrio sp.]|uniref:NADH-quinone oxidoreductase subunit NuoH n=1 Tax=Propionivibrio sp. TaxID=2212460 RepID=UPI003BF270D3
MQFGQDTFGSAWQDILTVVWTVVKVMLIIAPLLLIVAYLTFWERKVIGWMQVRIGPNRVGPWGLIQPIADGLKLLFKEIVIPSGADKSVFLLAPAFAFAPALIAWAVIPFNDTMVLANVNASLLYIMAVTSIGVYGIILAGWASNSKYAFLGGMRSAAQLISYEIAMGLALVVVLMVSNSLNLGDIVRGQGQGRFAEMGLGFLSWNWLPLLPMFVVYLVSIVAETNRAPFDMAEGESEIVGFHVEYSGMAFAVFSLAEYSAMILCATLTSLLFLGGWLSPVWFLPDSIFWLFAKISAILFFFLWIRATFPRYRYDQIMRLGWKVFIPVCLIWLVFVACWMMSPWNIWK